MKKTLYGLAAAALLAVPVASAHAALNAYLKITGSHTKTFAPDAPSGFFQALCTNEQILPASNGASAAAAEHSVKSPRDPATGLSTGRRQYAPIIIRKRIDKASPLLARAWASQETLPQITMFLYREAANNMVEVYAEVTFSDCVVKQYDKASPMLAKRTASAAASAGGGDEMPMESVSFSYAKISWTYLEQPKTMKNDSFKWDLKENKKA